MRRLIGKPRRERGVTAVLFAVMAVCLVAVTGLGVDTGNLALQSSRVQHSADAAAFAIAYDCVARDAAKCSPAGGGTTASYFASENSSGGVGSVVGPLSTASTQVTVSVTKPVSTYFMNVVGINSRNADNTATAQWKKHVVAGDVLPYGVSLCAYVAATAAPGQVLLPGQTNNDLPDLVGQQESDIPYTTCSTPAGTGGGLPTTVSMLNAAGLWINDGSSANCDGKETAHLYDTADTEDKNEGCTWKYADDVGPKGNVLLMAIYAPRSNFSHGGLQSKNGKVTSKATIELQIVGFAPFKVDGWYLSGASGGDSTGGRDGILGKFISSAEAFDGAQYGTDGANFGAVEVELIN